MDQEQVFPVCSFVVTLVKLIRATNALMVKLIGIGEVAESGKYVLMIAEQCAALEAHLVEAHGTDQARARKGIEELIDSINLELKLKHSFPQTTGGDANARMN